MAAVNAVERIYAKKRRQRSSQLTQALPGSPKHQAKQAPTVTSKSHFTLQLQPPSPLPPLPSMINVPPPPISSWAKHAPKCFAFRDDKEAGQNIIHIEPLFSRRQILSILNLDVRAKFLT